MFEPIYRKYYDRKQNSIAIYKQIDIGGYEELVWNDKKRYWTSYSNIASGGGLCIEILHGKTLDDIKVEIL